VAWYNAVVPRGSKAESVELVSMDKFKAFVRRIVSVPKKEIDRRISEQKRRKHK